MVSCTGGHCLFLSSNDSLHTIILFMPFFTVLVLLFRILPTSFMGQYHGTTSRVTDSMNFYLLLITNLMY